LLLEFFIFIVVVLLEVALVR